MPKDRSSPHAPGATVRIEGGAAGSLRLRLDVLRLEVLRGPDAGKLLGLALPLVRVGTHADNDLVLTDPSVSGHHAELRAEGDALRVRDLDSTNGTAVNGLEVGEAALPEGATLRLGETELAVTRAQEVRRALAPEDGRLGDLVGASEGMQTLFTRVQAVAPTPVNVLIQAESGCGKELVARTLHQLSGRPGPLVVFDAATADREMLRADLFGHESGAFTGAAGARPGAFRAAHKGTLFLDELGELPLDLQPRLLRALESRAVQPLGSDRAVPVDVRVVAATHRDLGAMVRAGEFRADLYHRLAVIPLTIPPLRERLDDLDRLLAALGPTARFSAAARAALAAHSWPGNVRELRNVLERVSVLAAGREATPEDLMLDLADPQAAAPSAPQPQAEPGSGIEARMGAESSGVETLEEAERRVVLAALERNQGNKTATARELGIGVNTLRRKLQAYGAE